MIGNRKSVIIYIVLYMVLVLNVGCAQKTGGKNWTTEHESDSTGLVTAEDDKKPNVDKDDNKTKDVNEINGANEIEGDTNYVTWAVPALARISDENIVKVNNKLKNDGYPFGLKIIRIEELYDDGYLKRLDSSGADIVFTGIGVETSSSILALKEIIAGKYEDLTGYIEKSPLKNLLPQKIIDASSYDGKIYLLPSEYVQDGADQVLIYEKKEGSDTLSFEGIDSDVFKLESLVSQKNKLFYGFTDFEFVRCFGYYTDSTNGIVLSNEGKIINPFEDEKCLRWMRMINKFYINDKAPDPRTGDTDVIMSDCALRLIISSVAQKENGQIIKLWAREMCNRYGWSTAIRKASNNKENAFKFLELIRTDHDYGNLLIYGKTEEDGNLIEDMYMDKIVLGLDDGLLQMDDGMRHFTSYEERIKFYDESVKVSPSVYMEIPMECPDLAAIVKKYLTNDIILFSNDFEAKFEMFKKEYTETFDTIFGEQ